VNGSLISGCVTATASRYRLLLFFFGELVIGEWVID